MQSRGITQADIERITGLSKGTVNHAVHGKASPETLMKLSRDLKAPIVELTDNMRLIVRVAAQTAAEGDLDILAQTASAVIEKALRSRK